MTNADRPNGAARTVEWRSAQRLSMILQHWYFSIADSAVVIQASVFEDPVPVS
jgi:hypothetical protein